MSHDCLPCDLLSLKLHVPLTHDVPAPHREPHNLTKHHTLHRKVLFLQRRFSPPNAANLALACIADILRIPWWWHIKHRLKLIVSGGVKYLTNCLPPPQLLYQTILILPVCSNNSATKLLTVGLWIDALCVFGLREEL